MRVFERAQPNGGTRFLILGASAYSHAQINKLRVPKLAQISSASTSALRLATEVIANWQTDLKKPLASVDLLVDSPVEPDGTKFDAADGRQIQLEAPTIENIKKARKAWMNDVSENDVLIFYCCGHGIWLPSCGRTFLSASFGSDEDDPWPDAVALDDFAFALGEAKPRQQWLIFDCCNNTPPQALKQTNSSATSLLSSVEGQRAAAEEDYGHLSQVIVKSASQGALAFGKEGRPSRFMEAFLEACAGAGCRRPTNGRWWVDQQGIEEAMATYAQRVAPVEEQDYFTFARVTETDAPSPPLFLGRNEKPRCTMLVQSTPAQRLKHATVTIKCQNQVVAEQRPGEGASVPYKVVVTPWLDYDLEAAFGANAVQQQGVFATPPLCEIMFEG